MCDYRCMCAHTHTYTHCDNIQGRVAVSSERRRGRIRNNRIRGKSASCSFWKERGNRSVRPQNSGSRQGCKANLINSFVVLTWSVALCGAVTTTVTWKWEGSCLLKCTGQGFGSQANGVMLLLVSHQLSVTGYVDSACSLSTPCSKEWHCPWQVTQALPVSSGREKFMENNPHILNPPPSVPGCCTLTGILTCDLLTWQPCPGVGVEAILMVTWSPHQTLPCPGVGVRSHPAGQVNGGLPEGRELPLFWNCLIREYWRSTWLAAVGFPGWNHSAVVHVWVCEKAWVYTGAGGDPSLWSKAHTECFQSRDVKELTADRFGFKSH